MGWIQKKADELQEFASRKELSRIKKAIQKASSTHHGFTTRYGESVESSVDTVLAAYDSLNSRCAQAQRDIVAQEQAKLKAHEEIRQKDGQIILERQEHQNLITSLERAHQEEIAKLEYLQQREREESQMIINDLKSNLFGKKEQVTGLADRDLSAGFKAISKSIEQLSRIDWDPSRETRWPYSERELSRLHPRNTRRLKQQIVQNCIWLMLYDSVFRRPFQIIGEYGRTFDSSIYEAGSPEFSALELSEAVDYNNKRYMNAEVLFNALKSADTRSAKDVATLQSYNNARQAAVSAVRRALDNITAVDIHDEENIDQVWKAAVEFWLEACSQRYRFFVIMPENVIDVLGSGSVSVPLRLIVKPELQRFGSLTGSDLNRGEVLAGWKSEVETYYA